MDHTHPGTCPDCPEPCEVCDDAGMVYRMPLDKVIAKWAATDRAVYVSAGWAEMIPCPECTIDEPDPDEKYDRRIEDDMYWRGEK